VDLTFHARYTDGRNKFEGLDAYSGAMSLLGLSQIMLISFNAFYNREILTQAPSASGFRVVLGTSKEGSWDQTLKVIVTNSQLLSLAADLGKSGLYDLFKYALVSGIGGVGITGLINRKAKKVIRELENAKDDLSEKLDEALKRAHAPVKQQGLTVHVMAGRTILATFNEQTLEYIETEVVHDNVSEQVFGVSRFNARTGTGRFIAGPDAASIPFSPADALSDTSSRSLVDSLAYLTRKRFVPVKALVSEVTSASGSLKSYRLHSAWDA